MMSISCLISHGCEIMQKFETLYYCTMHYLTKSAICKGHFKFGTKEALSANINFIIHSAHALVSQ